MDSNNVARFMIIDDDPINNHICTKYIQLAFPGAHTISFTDPQKGLDHIHSAHDLPAQGKAILLLDINMPGLNGWEVLERFAHFPDEIKKNFKIYILSSSIAWEDKNKAESHPLVSGFIEKPITIEQLKDLFPEFEKLKVE
jgi:CheY-like chemotaxis protein